jgi:undecaprenyl diphosphate synthase
LDQLREEMKPLVAASRLRHVAMIMDGNRRWAQSRHLPKMAGHAQGVETLKAIVQFAGDIGVEALTVYAFSTENWRRADEEVGYLLKLFLQALSAELDALHAAGVRLRFIGDLSPFPGELVAMLNQAMATTAQNTGLKFQVAINYGARAELVRAARVLAAQVAAGTLAPEQITEEAVQGVLYTEELPDPDLVIRTGGESRLSNFLLWQAAYAEIYVTETPWPEFMPPAFCEAIREYVARERRFGK